MPKHHHPNNNNNIDDDDNGQTQAGTTWTTTTATTTTNTDESATAPRIDLLDVVDSQPDVQLNIQFHIGNDEIGFLSAKDLIIELHHDRVVPAHHHDGDNNPDHGDGGDGMMQHAPLPGADGYYHSASSGHRTLDVLSKARYINQQGLQLIDCQRGCWEMCWLKDKPSGSLVCGFHIPTDYRRNDAMLPCGDMWLSFPVWTVDGLKYGQYEKKKTIDEIHTYLAKRDEELNKFDHSRNPIMRAIYLRNAFNYAEKCSELDPEDTIETIPENNQVEKLQNDLLLSKYGMIWRKHGEGHVLLGHAVATKVDISSPTGIARTNKRLRP